MLSPVNGVTKKRRAVPLERVEGLASLADGAIDAPDGYRILTVAREGDNVIIYNAVRERDDLQVLLETPRSARPNERDHEQLAHELAVLTFLAGAPVATALAIEHAGGRPWLVLADAGGESLDRAAARFRAPANALTIGATIAGALAEVHQRGVIHRDLRPHHVLVLEDGSVRLTDFRSASLLGAQCSAASMPVSLAYVAPEQTGRMNGPIDKRADLYSFGVILYELLTGRHPFEANNALEWIHAHIAKTPVTPSKLDERIPASADAIVLKLLSKHAEDRYHNAAGLQRDLKRCAGAVAQGETGAFELGTEDPPDDFRVAQRLYGREVEVAQLLDGFERAKASRSCVVTLIGGYSGVGKSSLVGELYQPLVRDRGRFVSGKCDQYKRDIPYSTIVQAFRDLLRELLSVGEESLAEWRDRIREALGVNGQLIVDVLPELELIVGAQPPVFDLDAFERQNRFELVLGAFVRVFARPQHPLVVFLDDVQWADGATLGLLKMLVRPGQFPDLQVVLAFRTNEVDASHPFQLAIDAMRLAGANLDSVTVLDLEPPHVLQLVADTVSRQPPDAASLATMIGAKAGGNPFFIGELLQVLHARGLLTFDAEIRGWTWDDAAVRALDVTDNVVDLLIARIRSLPNRTIRVLTLASCFGSRFDGGTLAMVLDESVEAVDAALHPALGEGFLAMAGESLGVKRLLRFQHDRIQQAAYSLAADERAATHLRIGRVLRDRFAIGEEEVLFEAVKHLDHGAPLLVDVAERQQLVELNLLAGRRAKAAIAWEPARIYLAAAASLFDDDAWTTNYATTFAVLRELAECEFLVGQFASAEARFDELRRLARSRAERGDVANSQVKLYTVMGRYDDALRLGLAELEPFGEPLICLDQELGVALSAEHQRLSANLFGVDLRLIVDLPFITEPEPRALIALLTSIAPAVYSRRPSLFPLLAMRIVNLSFECGNCEHSCFGYSIYAMTLADAGDAERALSLSEASLALNERFRDPKLRGTVLHIHANHIVFWRRSYAEASSLQERAYLASMEVGDLTIAAYISFMGAWQCLARGEALSVTDLALARFERFADGSHHEAARLTVQLQRHFGRALAGLTRSPLELSDERFDSDDARALIERAGFDTGLVMHDLLRAMLAWYQGDYRLAESWLMRSSASLPAAFCLPLETTWMLFDALTAAALWDAAAPEARLALSARVVGAEVRLRSWARGCPENFGAEHALAAAELARLEGRGRDALYGYEQAADAARRAGQLPLETIAAQLAVRLARSSKLARATRSWIRDAHAVMSQWGASTLLGKLQAAHLPLLTAESSLPGDAIPAAEQQLDVLTAIKASQAVSRETAVDGLTQALLRVVLEHAGAQRSVVLLVQHGQLKPAGAASVDGDESHELPESIVRYVERSCAAVVLADAIADPIFGGDAYVVRTRARSVMCLPILVQSRVVGLIYLENNLVTGAFAAQRLALLEVVSTQLAISLENANLYQERQERAEQGARQEATIAAEVLERSRLAALFQQAPAAIAMLDGPEHVITLANSQYQRMAGDRPLTGLTIRKAFPDLVGQGYFELLDRVFETGEAFHARGELVKLARQADGTSLDDGYYDFVYQPFRDTDQAVKGIMVLGFEVADRVQALRAIKDGEERLRLAIEASAIGNWEMDLDTGSIVRSVRFDEIFGYIESPATWGYRQFLDHVLPSQRAAVESSFNSAVGAAGAWIVECGITKQDGTPGWLEVRGQLRPSRDGRPMRMFGTAIDVTFRKTLEAERQALMIRESAARREAEAANRSKDEFLAMLGHELRNPLAPIVTALHLLRLRDGDRNQKERSVIERHVTHLGRLVDDLLDVSRITSGKIELKRQPIELAEVVAKAIELVSPMLEQRRHELVVNVPYHGVAVDGDMTRLAQVISNLLANAAKYTEPGGRVTIIAERIAEDIVLRVCDTGIGIAPAMLPRVFDFFVQEAQALSRSQGGLGLGLAIVRSLVGLHGGTVSAASAGLGRGTELTVRLPAIDLPSSSAVASVPAAAFAIRPSARCSSVLIVDDNEDAAELLEEALEGWGYTARVAYDGPAAMQLVTEFTPDVALLDIGLPVMDGYELARLLKQIPSLRRTYLVALTGYGQETDRQRSRAAGFDAHLVKPIDMTVLQSLIKGWSGQDVPTTDVST